MKRNISSLFGVFGSIFISTMVYTAAVNAQYTTNWVAINDLNKGTKTSPYASIYHPLNYDAGLTGPLTNTVDYALLPQGQMLPVTLTISVTGTPEDFTAMGSPNAGTPAMDWFGPYVEFSTVGTTQ